MGEIAFGDMKFNTVATCGNEEKYLPTLCNSETENEEKCFISNFFLLIYHVTQARLMEKIFSRRTTGKKYIKKEVCSVSTSKSGTRVHVIIYPESGETLSGSFFIAVNRHARWQIFFISQLFRQLSSRVADVWSSWTEQNFRNLP